MNSKTNQMECFVYITLPGQTKAITAGKFIIKTDDKSGLPRGLFRYGQRYLEREDKLPLDPIELKLSERTYETVSMKGVFGALRDAGPDYWGRRIIERHAGKTELSEIDYLLYAPDDRAGALGFGTDVKPPAPLRQFNQTLELDRLQKIADAIVSDEEIPVEEINEQIEDLILIGTSMGGARPKAVVEDDDGLWVAKFNRPDDKWNCARVEHAMRVLANSCGIKTAISKVIKIAERDVLLVKRFDREKTKKGYLRSRMVSGLTLLRAEDTHKSRDKWSYLLLVEEIRRISVKPKNDAQELFKRMCFNALISNTDDHPRNHALVAKDSDWTLSPAYDLTPFSPISVDRRDLALICGDAGRYANADNLLSQCNRFLLSHDEANEFIEQMQEQVKKEWYSTARSSGVSEQDCNKISGAFLYDGFLYKNT
ncbi:MAG: HipA domain-containing protein [Proteobacteria bacterium]|nr:HipA domain-containing protein [Pseudomonadota bacterium]